MSPGCAHCYALDLAARLKSAASPRYQRDGKPYTSGPGFGVTLHEDLLEQPLRWRRPRRVFVNSMSDLFHEEIPFSFIERTFAIMKSADQHTYQVLTKRPERMLSFFEWAGARGTVRNAQHIWLGVSVESQYWADRRVPLLLEVDVPVHFLSCEPLLGQVDLRRWLQPAGDVKRRNNSVAWVIAGGESGVRRRPMDPTWVHQLRDQCLDAEVPFFFKQWGGRTPKAGGRLLDDRLWDELPATQPVAAAAAV